MRLGQLARKLSIRTDEIISYLSSCHIDVDPGGNTRLDESHVAMILERFSPDNTILKQQIEQEPEPQEPATTAETEESVSLESPPPPEVPDVIKAPKIELPGLRVVGKIELPEKKKTEPPPGQVTEAVLPTSPMRRPSRNIQAPKPWKNPITLQREREEREKQHAQKEQTEKEKQRRTEFYMKRLKPQPPTRQAKLVQEDSFEMPPLEPDAPKTWWGRFMRWLNT